MTRGFWLGRRVFITGHTGFKGGWLSIWLRKAGAEVFGYATSPPTEPNLFTVARVAGSLAGHTLGDVRDGDALSKAMRSASPEVVFHLAAQPLVRQSYKYPVETFDVNVMGTVNMLEAVRACPTVRAVLNVTTDKCYENKERPWGYREAEPLGGRDPYSSSKACSELVTSAYRDSFFRSAEVAVATGRAGNVIGGGDWAMDRLLPDFFRALEKRVPLEVRFPNATRPWQHVLEPLSGYMLLAEQLVLQGQAKASSWNFGPSDEGSHTVRWILNNLATRIPEARWTEVGCQHVHESGQLKLDSSKARDELDWRPRWAINQALKLTAQWYMSWKKGGDMSSLCLAQISEYESCDAVGVNGAQAPI